MVLDYLVVLAIENQVFSKPDIPNPNSFSDEEILEDQRSKIAGIKLLGELAARNLIEPKIPMTLLEVHLKRVQLICVKIYRRHLTTWTCLDATSFLSQWPLNSHRKRSSKMPTGG